VNDNFSVGFGVSYIYSTLALNLVRLIDIEHPLFGVLWSGDVPAAVEGASGSAIGFNAGALYKYEKFAFGVNWRSGFKITYKGDLDLDPVNVPAAYKQFIPPSGDVETTFNFPHVLGFGASYHVSPKLLLSADLHYILWNSYDKYVIKIDYPDPYPDPAEDEVVTENWKNSFLARFGLQYQLNEKLALRGGAFYDKTPQPVESMDPNLPDANRFGVTFGFGYRIGNIILDAAFQHEVFSDRTSPNREIYLHPLLGINFGEGTYSTSAELIGLSISYVF
jgi:long-chain fatty acid transport protein